MKQILHRIAFSCTFFLFLSPVAYAFDLKGLQPVQPYGGFSGFSAFTMEKGVISAGIDFERSIETDFYRATLKTGYGITSNTEALLTIPYTFEWREKVDGFEDISIGVKQRFFRENRYGPSIAYLLKLSFDSGEEEFGTKGAAGAGLIVSKKLGPFSSNINFLYSEPFDDSYNEQMEFIFGLAFSASHDFDIIAELYAVDNYAEDGFETIEGRLGYRIRTSDNVYTVLGAGYDFQGRDPEFRIGVSFNFLFGDRFGRGTGL